MDTRNFFQIRCDLAELVVFPWKLLFDVVHLKMRGKHKEFQFKSVCWNGGKETRT